MSAQSQFKKPAGRAVPPQNYRARLIRLVHVGRRELKLDEASYRAILQAQAGIASSSDGSALQLQAVVDYMVRQGFKIASKSKVVSSRKAVVKGRQIGVTAALGAVALASDPESRKARAMWLTLHEIGQVRDPSEAALLAYARRQTGVQRMEWVVDMVPVLEPLKAWLLRSMPQALNSYLREPASTWAGHMDSIWHENWQQAVTRLRGALERRLVQLVDEYVDLWHLVQSAREKQQ
ncbi:hypothetical protein FQZ97_930700 [compost metagenome]